MRLAAQVSLVIGAIGSVALMLFVGHRNQSIILMLMFAGWVLAPFAALAWVDRSPRFQIPRARMTLHALMVLCALSSLCVYGLVAFGASLAKPAAPFLLVPLGALLVIAVALPLAARSSR